MPSRQNQHRITVSVDGRGLGVFETRTGGETDSTETLYQLGGMGPRISLGGVRQVGNVTCARLFDLHAQSQAKWLLGRVGKGKVIIIDQPLDDNGHAFGEQFVWTGTLKRVQLPEYAADSSDGGQIEVEVSIVGDVG